MFFYFIERNIILKETNEPIGSVGIMFGDGVHSADMEEGDAEIGYWLGVPYWGQGLIPEAVNRLLSRCFEELDIKRVWCGHYDENTKSRRVMEKCGFKYHHTEEGKTSPLGDIRTEHFTLLTREEWKQKNYHIRPLTEADIPEMQSLFRSTVLFINTKDYTQEEAEDWASCGDSVVRWKKHLSNHQFVGAFNTDNKMVGYSSMNKDGYLHSMFVHKDWQGKGIASLLLTEVENMARQFGVTRITSEVSLTARPFFVSSFLLPPAMERFRSQHSGIRFELYQGLYYEIEDWVREGVVDFGFTDMSRTTPFACEPIYRDTMLAVLPKGHPLGENIFIQVDELAAEPFILLEEGRGGGCIRELLARHPQINVQYRVADDYTILNMVESRLGVSILPEAVLRRSGQRLTARRLSPELQRTIGVIYKQKTGLSTAGQLFLSELKASRPAPHG